MNKLATILVILFFAVQAGARPAETAHKVKYPGGKTYMFRVMLKDKHGTPFTLAKPRAYLSEKALARRRRQNIAVDSTDLPVNPAYVKAIRRIGVDVVSQSKWNNTVLVRGTDIRQLRSVDALGCVAGIKLVWTSPDSINKPSYRLKYHKEFNRWDTISQTGME